MQNLFASLVFHANMRSISEKNIYSFCKSRQNTKKVTHLETYQLKEQIFIVVKPTVDNKEGIGMSQVKWTMRIFRAEERTETKAWKRVIDVS